MKKFAPAASRNSGPIADVLARELPETGLVLEVASGTGEHVVFLARRFTSLQWQPTDPDLEAMSSIASWREEAGLANLLEPRVLDASSAVWPVARADAMLCINMIHISPWAASEGLFAGAARLLGSGAPLIIYGPYIEDAVETAPSNLAFDESLRARNPAWGLRNIADIDRLAWTHGFTRTARYEMPANNLTLIYRRA